MGFDFQLLENAGIQLIDGDRGKIILNIMILWRMAIVFSYPLKMSLNLVFNFKKHYLSMKLKIVN